MIVFCLILFYNFFYLLCLVLKWFFWLKHTELGAWLNVLSFILVCANAWRERTNLLNYEGKEKKNLIFFFGVYAELAASVPRTEIVGKSDYFRFGMRDSLAIEASFLQVILQTYLLVCYSTTPILCVSSSYSKTFFLNAKWASIHSFMMLCIFSSKVKMLYWRSLA